MRRWDAGVSLMPTFGPARRFAEHQMQFFSRLLDAGGTSIHKGARQARRGDPFLIRQVTEMQQNWNIFLKSLSGALKELRFGSPEVMKGFSAIAQAALKPNALDTKTKELIALAISVATRCDDCIGFHVKAAIEEGATREEILETLGTAIYLGAGPSVMYTAHAVDAFDDFTGASSDRSTA
jgi:AhpD family alkylhydroperoxidase